MTAAPALFFLVLVAAVHGDASAHVVAPGTPLSSVLHHPAFEPVHALAFIGGGLWAGQQAGRTGWVWIGTLVAGVLLGIALGVLQWLPPWRSPMVFGAAVVFGTAAALNWCPPVLPGAAVFAVAGIYQGVVGSIPEYMGGSGHNAPPDIAIAALILSVLAREVSFRARPNRGSIVVRIAGSWVAAIGILLLAFTLRLYFGVTAAGHSAG